MNNKTKVILGIVVFALFLGIAYSAYSSLSAKFESSQQAQLGQDGEPSQGAENPQDSGETSSLGSDSSQDKKNTMAPDFTVYGTDGTEYRLSDFRGKPVVVNFWASWCPPCRQEMPHFNEVYGEYKDKVAFLMVDLVDGQRETETSGAEFVRKEGFDFPIYLDKNTQAAAVYGVTTIPTTLFIDSEGYLFTGYRGPLLKSTLETVLDSML